jgi:hypothetical protein
MYLMLKGRMDVLELRNFIGTALEEGRKLKPGFGVSTDISEFVVLGEEMRQVLEVFLRELKELGAGRVVRVVNPLAPILSLQWQRTSWKVGYTAENVVTLWQADQKLDELENKQIVWMSTTTNA